MASLKDQAKELPEGPGVYRFDDSAGSPLYIGKAINLKRRVRQHLDRPMREGLLEGAVSVEAFETEDENRALALERELIRRHRPPRNIIIPSRPLMLCVTDDDFPRLVLTRAKPERSWRSFGPYDSAGAARRLLEVLEVTFQLRTCTGKKPGRPQVPCLEFYMSRCTAPCAEKVSKEQYSAQVEGAISVLQGQRSELTTKLEKEMLQAAGEQDYERAGLLRDRISSLEKLTGRTYQVGGGSYDIVAVAREGDEACIEVRRVRSDQMIDASRLRLKASPGLSEDEIVRQFLLDHAGELDRSVVVESLPAQTEEISAWRASPVSFEVPRRGAKLDALRSAKASAERALARPGAEPQANPLDSLEALQQLLNMDNLPLEMECVDISNLGASQTVGAIVHLSAGTHFDWRALNLKERDKPNDVASIGETLKRRKEMTSWHPMPDLMVIDGGKGQLSRAAKELKDWTDTGMVLVSLAKQEELVFVPGRPEPLRPEGQALRLLQRLRDRTHDAAIRAHRGRRDRAAFSSPLEGIPGVGPARRKALIDKFGSLEGVLAASPEQLEAVVPRAVAQRIKEAL